MSTRKQVPGLITPTSNMVAPQVSTGGDVWKIVCSKKNRRKFYRDLQKSSTAGPKSDDEISISSQSSKSSSVSTGHTTIECSWADIVKNIDKAPLPKSTVA